MTSTSGTTVVPMGKGLGIMGLAPLGGPGMTSGGKSSTQPSGPMGLGTGTSSGTTSGPQTNTTVIRLAHANAASLAKVLDELFQGRCRIVAEPTTNSLLVQADDYNSKALLAVIEKVDVPSRPAK